MNQLNNGLTIFMSLLVEAIPFLLLGVLLSSVLLLYIDERKLIAALPRHPLAGALVGSLVGFLFPVCECGNVPVARRLLMQGVPPPVAIGFLLAAPTINPVVIWSTWTAFREMPEIVVLRVLFSLVIATTVGWVFSAQADLSPILQPAVVRAIPKIPTDNVNRPRGSADLRLGANVSTSPLLQSGSFLIGEGGAPLRLDTATLPELTARTDRDTMRSRVGSQVDAKKVRLFVENVILELRELGGVLVVGSAIAAAIQVLVPRDVILSIGAGPVSSISAMLLLAAAVSICSTVDAFFALSFASSFTTGSLLAFLVFGPMIDLKALGLMWWIFKGRAIVYITAIPALMTFFFTLAYNLKVG
ncbi:MAG TPA: permease [Oscillatoriaceae cyanobacterium M33_DOE_052]|uniref:Permease n=1 Tax=Planktothricoides sp. SpSt-374 TaxID=2282167 RepID=A0A7C3ZSH5_9CYAN|nr:permease [Oscillatoriaceae cyanobacterium M33_DOE_052]